MSVIVSDTKTVDRLVGRYDTLKSARCNFENLWQEVVRFICPDRADFTVRQPNGANRYKKLLNSVGIESAQFLAASLNGMMTDPSAKWFLLKFAGNSLVGEAWQDWLTECNEIFWYELYSPNANFGSALNETYFDDVSLNTSLLWTGWNEKRNGLMFQARTVAECVIDENADGIVDCLYRKFDMSARQLVEKFGEKPFDDKIRAEAKDDRSNCRYVVLHAVCPNTDEKGLPFRGVYVLVAKKMVLKEEFYNEFPYAVARWGKTPGEIYGRGPGIASLSELRMLQDIMVSYIVSAQKAADPPVIMQAEETFLPGATRPGGVLRYEATPPVAFDAGANFQVSEHIIERSENKVRKMFMNDRLADVLGDRATATEVIQIVRENARVLGPIYWRQVSEKLNPVLTRAFNLCLRHGKFPPFPDAPDGVGIDIEYISPMAQAFKYEKADRINQAFAASAAFMQIDPQSAVLIDAQKAVRQMFEIYGVRDTLRSQGDVDDILAQQAAAAQKAQNVSDAGTALELEGMQNEVKAQEEGLNNG